MQMSPEDDDITTEILGTILFCALVAFIVCTMIVRIVFTLMP